MHVTNNMQYMGGVGSTDGNTLWQNRPIILRYLQHAKEIYVSLKGHKALVHNKLYICSWIRVTESHGGLCTLSFMIQ